MHFVQIEAWILTVWLAGACALFVFCYLRVIQAVRAIADIRSVEVPAARAWPRISVIIPASNEAETIEPALRTLLAVPYPDLEFIVVDDRSSDGTGECIARVAREDPRVRALRVDVLPPGWLGKVHALHTGVAQATGEWLLFTDADVHFDGPVFQRAIARADARGLDHLVVLTDIEGNGFWLDVALSTFMAVLFAMLRVSSVEGDDPKAFVGSGAFNLVRRKAFERTPGFEWLRLEVADDLGLGLMVRNAGGKQGLLLGRGAVRIQWYPSLGAMMRGLEKNFFPVLARYSWVRFAAVLTVMLLTVPAPFLAPLFPQVPHGGALSALVFIAAAAAAGALIGRVRVRPLAFLLTPIGQFIMAYAFVRSAWRCWRTGGISWRGTYYPTALLRANIRVRM